MIQTIFHQTSMCAGTGIVRAADQPVPHCGTCTCPAPSVRHGNGTRGTCAGCGRQGILPDPGHEREFAPEGYTLQDNADGTWTLVFEAR